MMQWQRRMLGVRGVSRTQPGHHWMHGDVGKTESGSSEGVSDAGIHLRVVTLVGRHQARHGALTEDPREVVLPCEDLGEKGSRSEDWQIQ